MIGNLIEGVFTVPGKTKVVGGASAGATIIDVDSTVGFGTTGTIISGSNSHIDYTSKSINQFFGCTGVGVGIGTAEDIRADETILVMKWWFIKKSWFKNNWCLIWVSSSHGYYTS